MKPGDKVEILVDHLIGPAGMVGFVHDKNLTEGLISVSIDVYEDGEAGPILDFDKSYLKLIKEKGGSHATR